MTTNDEGGPEVERMRRRVDGRVAERRARHLRVVRGAGASCLVVAAVATWALTRPADQDTSVTTRSSEAPSATTAPRAGNGDGDGGTTGTGGDTGTTAATTRPAGATPDLPSATTEAEAEREPTPGGPTSPPPELPSPTVTPTPEPTPGASGSVGGPANVDPPATTTEPEVEPTPCPTTSGPTPTLAYVGNFNGQFVKNTGTSPVTIEEPVLLVLVDAAGVPATGGIWTARQLTTTIEPGQTVDVLNDFGETECRTIDGTQARGAMVLRGTTGGRAFQAVVPYTGPAGT